MMRLLFAWLLLNGLTSSLEAQFDTFRMDTWANWETRLEREFDKFPARRVPGRTMGILVPSDSRLDLIPITAFGHEVLNPNKGGTIVILIPAPENYRLDGLVVPEASTLMTSFGEFQVDVFLRNALIKEDVPIYTDKNIFGRQLPDTLLLQLASIKYALKGRDSSVKILPVMARFSDVNSQAKDLGPYIADVIRQMGFEDLVQFVIVGDLTVTSNEDTLIPIDSQWLSAIRNLDIDAIINKYDASKESESNYKIPDTDTISLGLLILKWLGGDHGEILTYVHSSQLFLTKNKSIIRSYVSAAFSPEPPIPPDIPHVKQEKLIEKFDELFRSDILILTRQTCESILNPAAAKPPTLIQKEARKKWPVYVSIYHSEGHLVSEAGTHKKEAPLQESLSRYAYQAIQNGKPLLTKSNFTNHLVEVSIPYGFDEINKPEDLIPLLNGIIVYKDHKSYSYTPNAWRTYPDPHQLLGAVSFELGLDPWSYASKTARIESFRVFSFNEKEPFQDLGSTKRKKKKKDKNQEEEFDDYGGDDIGGAFPF